LFFYGFSLFSIVFFMVFSKNWISKNWKSIDIHCWTPPMNNNGFPSMNINGFPSMNSFMVHQWIWSPSFGPLSLVPFFGLHAAAFGPHGARAAMKSWQGLLAKTPIPFRSPPLHPIGQHGSYRSLGRKTEKLDFLPKKKYVAPYGDSCRFDVTGWIGKYCGSIWTPGLQFSVLPNSGFH